MIGLYIGALVFLCAVLLVCLIYVAALFPGRERKGKTDIIHGKYIAHRGLFNNRDVAENTKRAFEEAIVMGIPIELDVQLTADGKLVVFHDETLSRMCRDNDKKVIECSYEDISKMDLLETGDRIPLFSDVLSQIAGRVPVLIEIKYYADYIATAKSVAGALRGYTGEYAIQSFHPKIVAWFRKNRPEVTRGLLSTKYNSKSGRVPRFLLPFCSTLLLNFYVRPDFISFDHRYKDILPFRLARVLYRFTCACWTIKDEKALRRAEKVFDVYIFDSFVPKRFDK